MTDMNITAIVEKGNDGLYSIYSEDHIGNSYFGGFGESVSEAKKDFVSSLEEALREQVQENQPVPDRREISITYRYDIPSFFNFFDFINVSKFAEYVGINESKMRAYKSGVAFPGEKTSAKIFKAVRQIALDLSAVAL